MTSQPLCERVVIQKIEKENVTASGIVLPDTAKEESNVATVIAVSEELKNSEDIHCDVVEGDKVIYSKYAGSEVEMDGETVIVLKYQDLLAKLN